jgi:ABC-type transport system involved in multi-copper enzyme maturation permease subunit
MSALPQPKPVRFQNPVVLKELRSRMRGSRAFVILTVYLLVMTAVATLVYLAYASAGGPGPTSATAAADAGLAIFAAVLAVEVVLVVFIGPAFTAGAISGERERQTFDLLRTTLLSAEAFVSGKLLSALSYVLLLIGASLPLLSIAFLLGGPSLTEVVLSQVLLVTTAVTYALFGLYCSARFRTTLGATVTTLAVTLFVTFGVPVIVLASVGIFGTLSTWSGMGVLAARLLLMGALLLAATNLPATLIVSEIILTQENSLFTFRQVVSGTPVTLLSPWPIFIVLHLAVAAVLFLACVRRVRRISDE